jgi:hypothetical protein
MEVSNTVSSGTLALASGNDCVLLNSLSTPAPEPHIVVLDLAIASPLYDLARKRRREYDLNRHFYDHWVAKMPWVEVVIEASRQVIQVRCKICLEVERREKLLVPKIDSLYKQAGRRRALANIGKVKRGEYYYLGTNQHVKSKRIFSAKERDSIVQKPATDVFPRAEEEDGAVRDHFCNSLRRAAHE